MVRSCQHHLRYRDSFSVDCAVHGQASISACSACKEFNLSDASINRPKKEASSSNPQWGRPYWQIGARLSEIIMRETGEQIQCSACQSEISRLNVMTTRDVLGSIDDLAALIVRNGQDHARSWYQRVACRFVPSAVAGIVRSWITEACTTPTVDGGLWESTIRHLTFHVFPTTPHNAWQWNITQLAKRWAMFNGTRIIAIATDHNTVSSGDVIEFAAANGMVFDHVVLRQNNPEIREVETWLPMLELLKPEQAGENEVVFACHAKGVRHDSGSETVQKWTQCMYESCLDYWPLVDAQLMVKLATGSFKRYGEFTTPGNHRWHYSGTFFWWRLTEIGRREWTNIDQQFFGAESWIGLQCKPEETGVLFGDNVSDMYRAEYWRSEVWPEWEKWKQNAHRLTSGS